jgi:ankyrin repeat protein
MTKHRLVDTLVENGADLAAEDQLGQSCLHYAAASGDFLLLQRLVEEFNMDFTRGSRQKKTPHDLAAGKCRTYLSQCAKDPPPKNLNFVPQRFLKKRSISSAQGGGGGGGEVRRHKEPRAIGTYLMKKSPSLMKGWQKRYFVMKEGHLRYYANVRS